MLTSDNSYVELSSKPPLGSPQSDSGFEQPRSFQPIPSSQHPEPSPVTVNNAGSAFGPNPSPASANTGPSQFRNNPFAEPTQQNHSTIMGYTKGYSGLISTPPLAFVEHSNTVVSHTVVSERGDGGPPARAPPPPPPPPPAGFSAGPMNPHPPKPLVGESFYRGIAVDCRA